MRQQAEAQGVAVLIEHTGERSPWLEHNAVCSEHVHFLDSTWADDSAAVTTADSAEVLLQRADALVRMIVQGCKRFGLTPNLKRGKSALLLALRGSGSRKAAARTFHGNDCTLRVSIAEGHDADICVEGTYLHLGTFLDKDGKMLGEARRALSRASGAFNDARQTIFHNEFLQLADRARIFVGLVQATLYNLELWTEADPAWGILHDGFSRLQKRLLAVRFKEESYFRLSHAEVLWHTGLPDLEATARRKRIGFLASLVRHGGQQMWALVQFEKAWGEQLRLDLNWFAAWSGEDLPDRTPQAWPAWWHVLASNPDTLKRRLARAAKLWRQHMLRRAARLLVLRDAFRQCYGRKQEVIMAKAGVMWCCPPCRRGFKTRSALGAHFKSKHDRCSRYRHLSGDTVCAACGKSYHSHERLLMHWKHATKCRGKLLAAGRWQAEPTAGVRTWKKTKESDFVLCPPEITQEPLDIQADSDVLWNELPLLEETYQTILDWLVPADFRTLREFEEGLLAFFQVCPLYTHEFRMIAKKLAAAARFLVDEEQMCLWAQV